MTTCGFGYISWRAILFDPWHDIGFYNLFCYEFSYTHTYKEVKQTKYARNNNDDKSLTKSKRTNKQQQQQQKHKMGEENEKESQNSHGN